MKDYERVIYGLAITAAIYFIAIFSTNWIRFSGGFTPGSFVTHSVMLLLSIAAIVIFKKSVDFNISMPKLKNIIMPIIVGVAITFLSGILMSIITKMLGQEVEAHPSLLTMGPLQVFLFVFIYASIAEEFLFRGFLLNILKPLSKYKVSIFSIPVIISALTFGLGHLVLISADVSGLFIMRILVFTTAMGLAAGYYQEKYKNISYAIVVHMAGNLFGLVSTFLI
ncbi:MAG: CPBP family intramembrane metalloprotease [Prevotellaceae bacterium]|jgi:membrane protease YdiL (CAAX protease family)|nr:CPBP family intramembrane metalloprotease [Prevotellaceae bacterium]